MPEDPGERPRTLDDLELAIEDWAWHHYSLARKWRQPHQRGKVQIEINYKRLQITDGETHFIKLPSVPSLRPQEVFKTTFENNGVESQRYSFKTERCTTHSCDASVQSSYTLGGELKVGFSFPPCLVEAEATFKADYAVEKAQGAVMEQTVSWGVDTEVDVPGNSITVASLKVMIDERSGGFEIPTTFSGPVNATILNPNKQNKVEMGISGNIIEVVQWCKDHRKLPNFELIKGGAKIVTKGNCTFRRGTEQKIQLENNPL